MKFNKLKIELAGAFWLIKEFEIEGIDVRSKWKDGTATTAGAVTIENFLCSPDDILDVYIHVVAPNRTKVKAKLTGGLEGISKRVLYEVEDEVRYGKLRINISEPVLNLLEEDI